MWCKKHTLYIFIKLKQVQKEHSADLAVTEYYNLCDIEIINTTGKYYVKLKATGNADNY